VNERPHRVLVVEDDASAAEALVQILQRDGLVVDHVSSGEDALVRFAETTYHILLTDLLLPGMSGIELTRLVHEGAPGTAIVLITGHATVNTAVRALQHGATDYLKKPIDPRKLRASVADLCASRPDYLPSTLLAAEHTDVVRFEGMVGRSLVMRRVFEQIRLAAHSDATVLITGESGTGKELVARAVHQRSRRATGPFVAVNTGAISPGLIASELFGHERGAFTGAVDAKEGQFEQAERGTLFLDEISTMDAQTQVNLLRVLETFSYTRVGGKKERRADVRVVAATNQDLRAMSAARRFREDLYYRLHVLPIDLPPLRDRREDILPLAHDLVAGHARRYGREAVELPLATQRLLASYDWPGNVRELRNVMEQALLLSRASVIEPEVLPQMIHRASPTVDEIRVRLGSTLADAEREIVLSTLAARGGNKKLTAEVLGISRRSLYDKLATFERQKKRSGT